MLRVFCVAAFWRGLCFVLQLFVEAVQHGVSCYSFLGLKHWTGLTDRLVECLGAETKAGQKVAAGSPFSG